MPRGGKRKGAGRKTVWHHGDTTVIRVPSKIAEQVLDFAHKLDQEIYLGFDTNSKGLESGQSDSLRPKQMSIPSIPSELGSLTLAQLAARLGCSTGTLHRHKKRGNQDLTPWSREKDSGDVGWEFREETQRYHPV